jgi:hypothetical protein
MLGMAEVHAGISDLERFFNGDAHITRDDARRCIRDINTVITNMSSGIPGRDKGSQQVQTFKEAFRAADILGRLDTAVQRSDNNAGLTACTDMRNLGRENGWMGFS